MKFVQITISDPEQKCQKIPLRFLKHLTSVFQDSGGFQMVSLIKLSELSEEGVKFTSPYDGAEIMLSPEKSMEIQNTIGADIMMQLDDVVSSTVTDRSRVEVAMHRSIRYGITKYFGVFPRAFHL